MPDTDDEDGKFTAGDLRDAADAADVAWVCGARHRAAIVVILWLATITLGG